MAANLSPSKKRKQLVLDLVATLIVLLLALLVVLPIWWIFRSSLMSTAKLNEYPPSFIPHEWLWANYSKALETFEYWRYFRNTFSIIIPAVTFGTVTAIFCGYAFARLRFRGKKLIFNICVGTILLPSMVTLLPLYVVWTKGLGLGDTYWPLILPYLTGGGFFNIFLIRQFLMTIPKELDEAAMIDGASLFQTLLRVIVPVAKPALSTCAITSFLFIYNELPIANVLITKPQLKPISVALLNLKGDFGTLYAVSFASIVISIIPTVIFYLIAQEKVESSICSGVVKG